MNRELLKLEEPESCQDCKHCAYGYMTQLDGQGVYRFAYCQESIVTPMVVDPGASRICEKYKEKGT